MKKLIFACLLATAAASAFAEWTKLGESDAETFYIDYKSVRKDGDLRKVWEIQDKKQRLDGGAISIRSRTEYDCKAERWKLLSFSAFSERMASGKTLISDDSPDAWSDIPPDSAAMRISKIVCAQ